MVSEELLARLDAARGGATRQLFIRNAIDRLCGDFEVFGDVVLKRVG